MGMPKNDKTNKEEIVFDIDLNIESKVTQLLF